MFSDGRVRAMLMRAHVTRHTLTAVEDLDRRRAEAGLQLLTDQCVRHAVVVMIDIDVIIEGSAHSFPFGIDIRSRGQ